MSYRLGVDMADLIARCEQDTDLAPPSAPVFPDWVDKGEAAE